jgi:ABC-type multidrug transport system ATPase subunit
MLDVIPAMKVTNLSKFFGKKQILHNISLTLNAGKVLGILGPNGAGKTTLLKIICGLVKPSEGHVNLNGIDSREIATIFDDQRFLGQLSGIKNMKLFLSTISEQELSLDKKFEQFGLGESKRVKYRVYSSGMKKRMDLMSIFLSGKKLFLLDEPTNGLDIDGMIAFNQQVTSIKNDGKSFVVASHHSLELEKVCDCFLLMDRGTVIAEMNKDELFTRFDSLESAYRSIIPR